MLTDKQLNQIKFMRATTPDNSISMWLKHLDFDNLTEQQEKTIKQLTSMVVATRRQYVIVDDKAVKSRTSRTTLWEKTQKGYKKTSLKKLQSRSR